MNKIEGVPISAIPPKRKLFRRSLFRGGLVVGHCLDGRNGGYGGGDNEFDDLTQRPSRPCLRARNFFTEVGRPFTRFNIQAIILHLVRDGVAGGH